MSINSVNGVNYAQNTTLGKKNINFKANETSKPIFETVKEEKIDASNDGKFTKKEALKNFGKGLISPLRAIVEHPLIALGAVAATGLACFAIPVLTPILTVGFGALSLYEVGKGTYNAVKHYKNGNYDESEKSFEKIGTGTIGTVLTAVGLKSSAKVAAEVKQANQLGRMLTKAEKVAISQHVQNGSMLSALKENLSIITTAEGRSALIAGFKPSNIAAQFKKLVPPAKPKPFDQTAEAQRRANMSTKDVEREVTEIINQAFDEMGIPKEARPKIVIQDELKYQAIDDANAIISNAIDEKLYYANYSTGYQKGTYNKKFFQAGEKLSEMTHEEIIARIKSVLSQADDTQKFANDEHLLRSLLNKQSPTAGGSYNHGAHQITFNTGGWREGRFSSMSTAVHESLHAKMAILRNSLTKEEAAQIIKQELMNRIKHGEAEEILVGGSFVGPEMMPAPKMSPKMRAEYAQFADDLLYQSDDILNAIIANESSTINPSSATAKQQLQSVVTRLKEMIRNNPEFVAENGGSEAQALETLLKYTKSHEVRFKVFSNTKIDGVNPIQLTPEQHQQAVESLIGRISTVEGNARTGGLKIFGPTEAEFNQYQFSYEELLARNTAAQFEKAKLQAMLQDTTLTAEKQVEIASRIDRLDFLLEYNRVGKQYYDLYTQVLNNPNDTALAEQLSVMTAEMERLNGIRHSGGNLKTQPEVYKTHGLPPLNLLPNLPKKEAA